VCLKQPIYTTGNGPSTGGVFRRCIELGGRRRILECGWISVGLTLRSAPPRLTTEMATSTEIEKVSLAGKLNRFSDYWSPKIVGELNDSYVKLVKLKGEFVWHHHETEDELFLVVEGKLLIKLRDRDIELEEGEFVVIPRGVEHLPIAEQEAHVLLLEPKTTLNTGNIKDERTVAELDRI
jgi:mannose-6-phosphate isomerase-like protein (cupin superfamily)